MMTVGRRRAIGTMLAAGTLALAGCQQEPGDMPMPSPANTVHVDATASALDSLPTLATDDAYAPFLKRGSADIL